MLVRRLVTVVILAPLLIGALHCPQPVVFKGVVLLAVFFSLLEFYSVVFTSQQRAESFLGILLGLTLSVILLFCPQKSTALLLFMSVAVMASFIFFIFKPMDNMVGIMQRLALLPFGALYVGGLLSYVGLLRDYPHGIYWVYLALVMTWLNDTFAYFVGHWWGRRRLAPHISPGKTVEGFIGGYVGSAVAFLFFFSFFNNPCHWQDGIWLTLLVGTLGPLGDLAESVVKRSTGVKDSGHLIPGHGGVLDRVDALLFTAPVIYYFAAFFYR